MKVSLRFSIAGLIACLIFLSAAVGVFIWLIYSAQSNPGDSGEGGILLVFFGAPWVLWLPRGLMGPGAALGAIGFNALLLYLVFGGLRVKR